MLKRFLALSAAALAFAAPAHAQLWDGPVMDAGAYTQMQVDIGLNNIRRDMQNKVAERHARRTGGSVATTQRSANTASAARTPANDAAQGAVTDGSYRPDPAVRTRIAGIMADKAAQTGAKEGAEMRQLVMSGEALRQYDKIAPRLGLRSNNAVDALAFYLLSQWGVANDHRTMFTPAQVAGVRRQAAATFAGVAGAADTDAKRQEFGEMLVIQAAIMSGVYETAVTRGDDAAARNYAAMARKGGHTVFGTDPTRIALTDAGFSAK